MAAPLPLGDGVEARARYVAELKRHVRAGDYRIEPEKVVAAIRLALATSASTDRADRP